MTYECYDFIRIKHCIPYTTIKGNITTTRFTVNYIINIKQHQQTKSNNIIQLNFKLCIN